MSHTCPPGWKPQQISHAVHAPNRRRHSSKPISSPYLKFHYCTATPGPLTGIFCVQGSSPKGRGTRWPMKHLRRSESCTSNSSSSSNPRRTPDRESVRCGACRCIVNPVPSLSALSYRASSSSSPSSTGMQREKKPARCRHGGPLSKKAGTCRDSVSSSSMPPLATSSSCPRFHCSQPSPMSFDSTEKTTQVCSLHHSQ
jgi:hypothetical protein